MDRTSKAVMLYIFSYIHSYLTHNLENLYYANIFVGIKINNYYL